jgi:hypothetical protein
MSQVGNAIKMYILLQANGKMKINEIASLLEVDFYNHMAKETISNIDLSVDRKTFL